MHVHPDPNELGRVYEPALGIVASGPRFAEALAELAPLDGSTRRSDLEAAFAANRATLEARELPGPIDAGGVMAALRERLSPDAIVTSGAGNFTVWAHRFYVFRSFRTQLRRSPARWATGSLPRSRPSSSTPSVT